MSRRTIETRQIVRSAGQRRPLGAWLLIVAAGLLACARSSAQEVQVGPAGPLAAATRQAWELAGAGRLEEALGQVKELTAEAEAGTPLASLARDISDHEAHMRQSRARAQERYEKQIARLTTQLQEGKLTDALLSATRAHDLTEDPRTLLEDPVVMDLVSRAEALADEQERAGKWLAALDLYRGLATLFEETDSEKYREPLRRLAGRVGLLRLYAPQVFYDLYVKQAQERGEKDPAPWTFDEAGWRDQLEGITFDMVTEALTLAADNHIESNGFQPLLLGGVEGLRALVSTPGLEATFPSLGNAEKVKRFSGTLDGIVTRIEARGPALGEADARQILQDLHRENERSVALPQEVVNHEFGNGAMSKLDEFSGYIWPHSKARFDRTTTQKFSGVGIQISLVDRQLTVVTPLEDTPAHRAGIRPGERIVTIDGKSTFGIDLDAAVDRITGPEGTEVTLGIQGPGEKERRDITLTRSSIKIVSVKGWGRGPGGRWDYYIDPALKIGYVRLTSFGPDTADELDAAVLSMRDKEGLNGLILDLRFNPGGRLDAAIYVSDRFIEKGVIVSTTQKSITGQPWRQEAHKAHTYPDWPVIVLINQGSASASEIVSGALKDHRRALIVGERSFGKGSVQNLFPIGGKAAYLKLTTQYYKLPDGQIIHRRPGAQEWGVEPDLQVRMTSWQTADAIRARTLLDILRADGEAVDPNTVISRLRESDDEPEEPLPPLESAQDILKYGLDPQLETAVLLLKTRILGEARS